MPKGRPIEELLEQARDNPTVLARLAKVLLAKNLDQQAYELCVQAIAADPNNAEIRALASDALGYRVPGWFFNLIADHSRHKAYKKAIQSNIRSSDYVLDIGTGTGLFAMLAARAGAAKIATCEKNAIIAAVASEIIARNGLSDRIVVIPKSSTDLVVGADLERKADVVICDNLSLNMIGAGILPVIEDAMHRLARQDARVIPSAGFVRIALAEEPQAKREMRDVEGFDLSPFNKLARPCYSIPADDEALVLRSAPVDLFHFDFQSGGPFREARAKVEIKGFGGRVTGIVQWNAFQVDRDVFYETRPGRRASGKSEVLVYPLLQAVDLNPEEIVEVCASHDRGTINIWTDISQNVNM